MFLLGGEALLALLCAGVFPEEEAGKKGARDAVIGTGDGTGDDGKGGHRVGGYHGRRCKEVAR